MKHMTPQGYMVLARINNKNIDIINKLSYLQNGKSLTGYHKLRQNHLKQNTVFIDYIELLDLYKTKDLSRLLIKLI